MMEKTCWNCKHNILKLKVLVPHDRTIREYVRQTGYMQSDIVAVVKEEPGQYTVWYRLGGDIKLTTFKMLHVCKLKMEAPKKQAACHCHMHKSEASYISNFIYSKVLLPAEAEMMH